MYAYVLLLVALSTPPYNTRHESIDNTHHAKQTFAYSTMIRFNQLRYRQLIHTCQQVPRWSVRSPRGQQGLSRDSARALYLQSATK